MEEESHEWEYVLRPGPSFKSCAKLASSASSVTTLSTYSTASPSIGTRDTIANSFATIPSISQSCYPEITECPPWTYQLLKPTSRKGSESHLLRHPRGHSRKKMLPPSFSSTLVLSGPQHNLKPPIRFSPHSYAVLSRCIISNPFTDLATNSRTQQNNQQLPKRLPRAL